jgi:signal transduction histidine kinase
MTARAKARRLTRWTVSLSLLSRAIAGSVVLGALVAATFGVMLIAVSDLRSSTTLQAQSRDVATATLQLEQVVNQLETSLRAYLLSGNKRFLASWLRAREDLPSAFENVNAVLANQPAQRKHAAQLSSLVHAYVTEYGLPLIAIYKVSPPAARSPVATREGVFRIDSIRNRLDDLQRSEARLASADAVAAKHQASRAVQIGMAALTVGALLLALFAIFVVRGIAAPVRTVADGASRIAAGDLSTRLPEHGAAEIHSLTTAFNAMARSLEQGKRELEVEKEELRQSERLKSQLVSIVSHELRTPLTSILGYTRLLLGRDFGKDQTKRYLETIEQQGNRLTSLIDHFLDSESVDVGQIELDQAPFDLRPLLREEVQLIVDKTTTHRIEVSPGAEPLPVRGDRDRLAQVFGNLLGNAVKYSPDGGRVEVSGEIQGDVVHVEVRDEGIGVPDEHQPRIFTKFFRGDARESGIAGTGLGLAVSREIVEAHGGRIGFSSRAGVGSHFWFELPLARTAAPEGALAGGVTERGEA